MPPTQPQPEQLEPILEASLVQQKAIGDETHSLLQAILVQQKSMDTEPLLGAILAQSKTESNRLVEAILGVKTALEVSETRETTDTSLRDILTALATKVDEPQDIKVTLNLI